MSGGKVGDSNRGNLGPEVGGRVGERSAGSGGLGERDFVGLSIRSDLSMRSGLSVRSFSGESRCFLGEFIEWISEPLTEGRFLVSL